MSFKLPNRVQETTTTAGTGPVTLAGAISGALSLASQVASGSTVIYGLFDSASYEYGYGTFTNAAGVYTLSRDTVIESSNGGSLVDFGVGTRNVIIGVPGGVLTTLLDPGAAQGIMLRSGVNVFSALTYAPATPLSTTLTLAGSSTPGTPAYSLQSGIYYRVGDLIYIDFQIAITAIGGMVGDLEIGGFPVATSRHSALCVHSWDNITGAKTPINVAWNGVDAWNIQAISTFGGTPAPLTAADIAATFLIRAAGVYML